MSSQPGVFPPLAAAITWARNKDRELHASLLLSCGREQCPLESDDCRGRRARRREEFDGHADDGQDWRDRRRDCTISPRSWISRWERPRSAIKRSNRRSISQRDASKWLFQIRLADYFVAGHDGPHLNAHRALDLYARLLRDPAPADWSSRPLESLAVLSTPHSAVYEHWFENTLDSGMELGLEVADRTRRHRFYSTLPLGGRLLSLRWVLESPIAGLDKQSQLERQSLLTKFPKYDELAKQVRKLARRIWPPRRWSPTRPRRSASRPRLWRKSAS